MMKRYLTILGPLLLLSLVIFGQSAVAQQVNTPARHDIQRAVDILRTQIKANPTLKSTFSASRIHSDADSMDLGGFAGRIEGITEQDSAWVLAIAAHLTDDPTAWALGTVQEDGSYIITGLKPGVYILMAGAEGYMPQYFSHAYFIWEAAPVDVPPGEIMPGLDFFLEQNFEGTGIVSGTVFDENSGEPVSGAYVTVQLIDNPFFSASVSTNDDGSYSIPSLRPGDYYVYTYAEGFFPQWYEGVTSPREATPVAVQNDNETASIDFKLSRGGTISGRVLDADGSPIVGAIIEAYPAFNEDEPYPDLGYSYGWAESDEDGNYLVSGLITGEYIVTAHIYSRTFTLVQWYDNANSFDEATPVPVTLGEDTPGIDFNMDINSDVGSLSGQITNADGLPIGQAIVRLESESQSNFFYNGFAYPDSSGYYELEGIPTGRYRVVLEYWTDWYYNTIWYDNAPSAEEATPIEILADQRVEGINFSIPSSDGVITGTVTDATGQPVPNAYIQLSTSPYGYPVEDIFGWAYAVTDENGAYNIENLIDGEYRASVFFCYFWECIEQWWPEGDNPDEATPIIVADGQSTPPTVDFTLPLELGSGEISGTVVNEDGEPLAGAQVSIMPYESITPGGNPDVWTTNMYTFADSAGNYSFTSVPAGTFIAFASYWGEGAYAEEWYDNADTAPDATPINVENNSVIENINFSLGVRPLYGAVGGQVLMEDGTPISRAYVKVNAHYGIDSLGVEPAPINDIAFVALWYAITNDDGTFFIEGLPAGTYSLDVYAQGASEVLNASGSNIFEIYGGERTYVEQLMRLQEEGPATLSGLVFGEQGDVPGISVVIASPVTDGPGDPYFTAIPDEGGYYRFEGLPEGDYFVQAMAPYYLTEYYENTIEPENASILQLTEERPQEGIDFSLEPVYYLAVDGDERGFLDTQSSTVQGRVTDADGEPLALATVYLLTEDGTAIGSSETLGDGSYTLTDVPPGSKYRLKATAIGYKSLYNHSEEDLPDAPALAMNNGSYSFDFMLYPAPVSTNNEGESPLPGAFAIQGNFPNPFTSRTAISLSLPQAAHVTVSIYDALGREVDQLVDGRLTAGSHQIDWDVSSMPYSLPSGLYFYRVTDGQHSETGKMMLLK